METSARDEEKEWEAKPVVVDGSKQLGKATGMTQTGQTRGMASL